MKNQTLELKPIPAEQEISEGLLSTTLFGILVPLTDKLPAEPGYYIKVHKRERTREMVKVRFSEGRKCLLVDECGEHYLNSYPLHEYREFWLWTPRVDPLPNASFGAVYSVLIEKAGAIESYRRDFIYHHTEADHPCDEWRFQGKLGFGGKYWRRDNRVSCYSEDSTPEREAIIAETNATLSSLNAEADTRR